jgi:hypothetical protein
MRRAGAEFGGSAVISGVATVLPLVAITGARRPVDPGVRGAPLWPAPHQEILVSYGSPPAGGVPSRYVFPAGM